MTEQAQVEVEESNEASPSNAQPNATSESAARESGLSDAEVEAGIKHGLIAKDGSKKAASDKGDAEDEGAKEGEESDEGAEAPEDKTPKEAADEDLDPEKEADLIKGYNTNEKSLYWQAKKERLKRQDAQRQSEHTQIKLAAAERELAVLRGKKPVGEAEAEGEEGAEDEADEDRVMTVGEVKKMLAKEREEENKKATVKNQEARETLVRIERQEAEFKLDNPDFDAVADLAKELMDEDPMYADIMLRAAADPKKNAAQVVYNIGRLHSKYKKGGTDTSTDVKPNKTKVEKAIVNADKRQSSASVAGGGAKRITTEDDITVADAAKLSPAAYGKLSTKTRERLMRETC